MWRSRLWFRRVTTVAIDLVPPDPVATWTSCVGWRTLWRYRPADLRAFRWGQKTASISALSVSHEMALRLAKRLVDWHGSQIKINWTILHPEFGGGAGF